MYQIKAEQIPMPKEGEMVLFVLPANTPTVIAHELEQRLAEAVNLDRRYLISSYDIKIKMVQIKNETKVEVQDAGNNNGSSPENK